MQLGRALTSEEARSGRYGRGQVIRSGNGLYLRPGVEGGSGSDSIIKPDPEDITTSYINSIKELLKKPDQPAITPFEQSGFYSENDIRGAANQEYDPWAAKQTGYTRSTYDENTRQQALQRAASDKSQLENVNAAGGFRSSAYEKDLADNASLRQGQDEQTRQALQRTLEEQKNTIAGQKDAFVQNRRNEAYQRYLQSIGAVTA